MNTFQIGESSAVGATKSASSPEHEWVIKIHKPATDGRPQELVVKDLSREQDVREILGWLDSEGWIVLKNVGDVEHEWDVSRDKYVNRIITAACLVVNERVTTLAPHTPTNENAPVGDKSVRLRCIFFAGDDSSLWNLVIGRKDAGQPGGALETVYVYGKDVFVCHAWLKRQPPQPVIDHPGPLLPGPVRSWNFFQKDVMWRP